MSNKVDITTVQTCLDMEKVDKSTLSPEQLPQSIYDGIITSARRYSNKTAIKYILDGDCIGPKNIPFSKKVIHQLLKVTKGKTFAAPYREISYGEVAKSVTQMANALTQLGIEREDVTSIILPNFPETYFSLWGAETAGIANPINPLLDAKIIKEIISTAGSKVLIALGPVPGSDIWDKVLEVKDEIPSLEAVICLFGNDIPQSNTNKVPVYGFEKLLATQNGNQLIASTPKQKDICSYFHTGGTTGLPKLAKHWHLNELTNASQMNLISPIETDDSTLIGLPIFHVNAAITGLASMLKGSTILLAAPSGFRGKHVIKNLLTILDNFNIGFMTAVPTVYAGLLDLIAKGEIDVVKPASMKFALCGAAPLSPDLQAKFIEQTNINLVEGYGSTEGTAVTTVMPVNSIATETAVGLTIPGMQVCIGDIDADGKLIRLCNTDEAGEILIAGNNVFPGYVDETHNTALWVTTDSGEKFVRTGDLGKQNEHGYLSLCGRKKELIIRGGHNIDPKMIEDVASSHPDVFLAAAVPRPDSYAGELPVLYVTKRADAELSTESLLGFMKENVPERAAIPKFVHIIDEMPLTAVGKLFKPELVCQEITHVIKLTLKQDLPEAKLSINAAPDKKLGIVANIIVLSNMDNEEITRKIIKQSLSDFAINYVVGYDSSESTNPFGQTQPQNEGS
jgi:fatty-acyl-CoA synthase